MSRHTKDGRRWSFRFHERVPSAGSRRAMKTWRPAIRAGRTTAAAVLDAFSFDALHPPKWEDDE